MGLKLAAFDKKHLCQLRCVGGNSLVDSHDRKLTAICLALVVAIGGLTGDGGAATRKKKAGGPSLPLIRDAEIEGLLRLYSKPIFRAAGLNPSAVRVYLISNDKINALSRARAHSHGLLTRAETPNEVIGVLTMRRPHSWRHWHARIERPGRYNDYRCVDRKSAVVGGAASGRSAAQAGQDFARPAAWRSGIYCLTSAAWKHPPTRPP
jgi:hypothetical protein